MIRMFKRLMESIARENERQFHGKRLNCCEINRRIQADAWNKDFKSIGLR